MSHTPTQRALAVAIAAREEATKKLEKYRHKWAEVEQAEYAADQNAAAAHAALVDATATRIKTGTDDTEAAKVAYGAAVATASLAEVEKLATDRVKKEAAVEVDLATKAALRAAIDVARQVAADHEPHLRACADAYGKALGKYKGLVRFARAASNDLKMPADPVADLNSNAPLKGDLDKLVNDNEQLFFTELSLLDVKLGAARDVIFRVGMTKIAGNP